MPIADKIEVSLQAASHMSEDELLTQLGHQLDTIQRDWSTKEQLSAATPPTSMEDTTALAGPNSEKYWRIGKRFLDAYNRSLYNLICSIDDEDHQKLKVAALQGGQSFGLVLAGVLAGHFAWLPAVAVFVASLLAKRFANDTFDTGCAIWKESLPITPQPTKAQN